MSQPTKEELIDEILKQCDVADLVDDLSEFEAEPPKSSTEELIDKFNKLSPEIKEAMSPATTKSRLIKLAETKSYDVHHAILLHPKANAEVLYAVWVHTTDSKIKDRILNSGKLTHHYRELIELGLA